MGLSPKKSFVILIPSLQQQLTRNDSEIDIAKYQNIHGCGPNRALQIEGIAFRIVLVIINFFSKNKIIKNSSGDPRSSSIHFSVI